MNLASRNTISGDATTSFTPNAFHQNVDSAHSPYSSESLKVFIKNIDENLADSLLESVLAEFGPLNSFRRTRNEKGLPVSFAFAEFRDVAGLVSCWRTLNKFKLGGKVVEVVINQQAKGAVAEYVESLRDQINSRQPHLASEQLDSELTDLLNAQSPVVLNRINSLVEGFLRNKTTIVKEEKKTGHKLYTEEKLNSHKQKYGLRNTRELEELFIRELRAWVEKDAQFRVEVDREIEAEKQNYQRKQQLLSKALNSKGEATRDAKRAADLAQLLTVDLNTYGLEDVAAFLGIEFKRTSDSSEHLPEDQGGEIVPFSSKKVKQITAAASIPSDKKAPLFQKVEIIPGENLHPLQAVTASRKEKGQKAIAAPETRPALPLAEAIMKTPGALKLLQEKIELERVKHELLRDSAKLKLLINLRKEIPSNTKELFGAKIKWKELEQVF